jgi:protein-tyrosine phosphatase
MFDLSACHVERTQDQNYRVMWRGPAPGQKVAVYMSDDPELYYTDGYHGAPLLHTTEQEFLIRNPDKKVRHYFCLESEQGEVVILAERQLSLQGTPNFRDLGGYEAHGGRRLKWGKLYRSIKLS